MLGAYQSHDESKIQAVVNVEGGELFRVEGDAPDWEQVLQLQGGYTENTAPDQVQLVTAGVDVQKDGLYYVVRGWGYGMESWLLSRGFIAGDTATTLPWDQLTRVLGAEYTTPRGALGIRRAFIDSGYRPGDKAVTPRNMVYDYCRASINAFPSKGQDSMTQPIRASRVDYTVNGVVQRGALQLWHIDTGDHKQWLYGRMRWPEDQPGRWHVFNGIDDEYAQQVTAEQQIVASSGRIIWRKIRANNHYLDCEVGALAAARSLHAHALRQIDDAHEKQQAKEAAPLPVLPQSERYAGLRAPLTQSKFKRRN